MRRNRDTLNSFGTTLSCFSWLTAAPLHAYFPSCLQDLRSDSHLLIISHDPNRNLLSVVHNLLSKVLSVLESRAARPRGCEMTFTPKRPTLPPINSVDESDTANKAFHLVRRTLYFKIHVHLGSDVCFLTQRRHQTQPNYLLSVFKSLYNLSYPS